MQIRLWFISPAFDGCGLTGKVIQRGLNYYGLLNWTAFNKYTQEVFPVHKQMEFIRPLNSWLPVGQPGQKLVHLINMCGE